MNIMSDRVVIITGAAKGIGLACARRFFEDGCNVVMADRDEAQGVKAAADIDPTGRRAVFVDCDVADKLSVHNLMATTLNHFGRIDVLVNNAGIALPGGVLDLTADDFDRVLGVNLRGAFLVSKVVCSFMVDEIENREDRSRLTDRPYAIINMSSVNDRVAIPDYLAYTVSKGGLQQMTKAMALELAPYGIRVNAIGPGSVKTDMLAGVLGDEKAMGKILARTPLGRPAQADEIAGVAAFLASEDASYITGETIYVDGGRMALNYMMPPKDHSA